MAVAEFAHFRALHGELERIGAVPEEAMGPFVEPLDEFHTRTAPSDWLESLVKAYVGDGIAADFYRAVAELLDPQAQALVMEVLADTGHASFVTSRVRAAIAADPTVAGRLALWARRLVGEALAQAHRVVADRPPLAALFAEGQGPSDEVSGTLGPSGGSGGSLPRAGSSQGEIGRMFARITDAHDQRMAALGLAQWPAG